jgi:hypothetical protein
MHIPHSLASRQLPLLYSSAIELAHSFGLQFRPTSVTHQHGGTLDDVMPHQDTAGKNEFEMKLKQMSIGENYVDKKWLDMRSALGQMAIQV